MARAFVVHIIDDSSPFASGRYVMIITDTLQNALSLGKSLCTSKEHVSSVSEQEKDVLIDHQAIGTQQI